MLLLECEDSGEVHPSYGGHEGLMGIYARHCGRHRAVSQGDKALMENFSDLKLEIQVANLLHEYAPFMSRLDFISLSLFPPHTIQACHGPYYVLPYLRCRLGLELIKTNQWARMVVDHRHSSPHEGPCELSTLLNPKIYVLEHLNRKVTWKTTWFISLKDIYKQLQE